MERISKINLAVLRLAIYEALYDEKVPINVAISEAVFLAEKYALDSDVFLSVSRCWVPFHDAVNVPGK